MRTKTSIRVVGCHAEGEVGDVIIGGVLPPPGARCSTRCSTMERDHDHIRRLLICEPRGSVARHVNLLVPSTRDGLRRRRHHHGADRISADVRLEHDLHRHRAARDRHGADEGAGDGASRSTCRPGRSSVARRMPRRQLRARSTFATCPAFVDRLDARSRSRASARVTVDIAYGGMFYAIVDATALGFAVAPDEARDLAVVGEKIRLAAREQLDVVHPENPTISGVSIVQFAVPFAGAGKVTRNTCIVSPGRSDRSPTGTGTSARMAVLHARGLMEVGDVLIHESIIGSRFRGRIVGETTGRRPSRRSCRRSPAAPGSPASTATMLDPTDPYPEGYVAVGHLGHVHLGEAVGAPTAGLCDDGKSKVFLDCRQTTIDCIGDLMQPAGAITRSDIAST